MYGEVATWQNCHGSLPNALPSRAVVTATVHERDNAFAICSRYLGQGRRKSEHRLEKAGLSFGIPSHTHICSTSRDMRCGTGRKEVDVLQMVKKGTRVAGIGAALWGCRYWQADTLPLGRACFLTNVCLTGSRSN